MTPKSLKSGNKCEKKHAQKYHIFLTPFFLDFLQIWAPKGLQIYPYFRRVFKKINFTKTSVSPRRERQIQGSQPSKNNQKINEKQHEKNNIATNSPKSKFSPIWTPKTSQNRP